MENNEDLFKEETLKEINEKEFFRITANTKDRYTLIDEIINELEHQNYGQLQQLLEDLKK